MQACMCTQTGTHTLTYTCAYTHTGAHIPRELVSCLFGLLRHVVSGAADRLALSLQTRAGLG